MTQPAPAIPYFTPEHLTQIAAARLAGRKIRRATIVALTGGWVTAIFAGLTLLGSIIDFSVVGLLLGFGMCVVSWFEFRGAAELKRLDITAPKRLAINQIVFAILLIAYAGIALYQNLHGPSIIQQAAQYDPEITKMLGSMEETVRTITIAVYIGVMIAALLGPGLAAVYYVTRTKYVRSYVEQTPRWIIDMQRAGVQI